MIRLYNTLTRKIEKFTPIRKGRVGLYTCGPTVYNYAHIGNLRTYVFEDVLRRTLEYFGYKVKHVMNITDVEDKIIRDSKKAGMGLEAFTEKYTKSFYGDIKHLGILPAWKYSKATAHIKEMIELINILLKKNVAYSAEDGVYFDISKFKDYGKLSRVKERSLKAGTRIAADEYAKHEAQDFALWKFKKDGEPSWPAPFGAGRPGWHIECSAMSMKYLGASFDIHAGGVDLIFPHHENEIAQSEGATRKQFVRSFIEGEHLLVDGKKMAKSLGNFYPLADLEKQGFPPLAFRYLALTAHYRSRLNFTWESLKAAEASLKRLHEFVRGLKNKKSQKGKSRTLAPFKKAFDAAIADDLDTPMALSAVWKLIREYNKTSGSFDARAVLKLLFSLDEVLGLRLKDVKADAVPPPIAKLVKRREALRKSGDWAGADKIRDELVSLGWRVKDVPGGPDLAKTI